MTTQVQVRGANSATQGARTLVSRELDIDTTSKRLNIHDGSTAGGIPHINYSDAINQTYTYASATGTNAIAITLDTAPTAYAAGQRFVFKAASTNTGSATLNVNSLGAKTIKKKDVGGGTIATLDAGDIISGGIYTAYYDGTSIILDSVDAGSGGAGWSLLDSYTGTSPSLTVPTGYSQYKVIVKELTYNASANQASLRLLRSSSAQSFYQSWTFDYLAGATNTRVNSGNGSTPSSDISFFSQTSSLNSYNDFSGVIELINIGGSDDINHVRSDITGNNQAFCVNRSSRVDTGTFDEIQFAGTGGYSIASSDIELWGLGAP